MAALLSGEADALSTGLGEALELAKAGEVRVLASTAPARIADAPDVPTLKEQGIDATFVNWRGFLRSRDCRPIGARRISRYYVRCTIHRNGNRCVRATVGLTSSTRGMNLRFFWSGKKPKSSH